MSFFMIAPAKAKLSRIDYFGYWQVLDVMEDRYVDTERWKMPEEEEAEEKDEFWGFEDLEYEWDSSFSISPHNSM